MGDRKAGSRSPWALARRQHGVVARRQLLEFGLTPKAIKHRVATGRLHPIARGVYAVGRRELTREGHWMAAVLVSGPDAFLSHRSAAALWGIGDYELKGRIDVSLRRPGQIRRSGIRSRTRPALPASDVTARERVPVTTIVRTLIDVSAELPENRLERAVNEADKHDLIDPDALRVALDSHPGEPGVRPLRKLLDKHTFRLSDEELERLFRPLAASAGLPVELTKVWVNDFEVDFFWPSLGLVVETDGWRYHRTPAAQTRDARRFQLHTASGLTPLRFSHWQVKYEPAHVRGILTRTVTHLRRGRPAPAPAR